MFSLHAEESARGYNYYDNYGGGSRISAHALPQKVLIVLYMYRI